jgi:hypothetical protein
MKWTILLIALLLVSAATLVSTFAAPIKSSLSRVATFNPSSLTLEFDGNDTTNGGGDPVPGGGIPK